MAFLQDSQPQHGCNPNPVADDIDYGPWTADQWARFYETMFTSDQAATQGVARGFLNEFLVSGAGVAVTVQSGAGLCNGHFIIGEGAPAWTVDVVPPAAAHTRCDYVVMLENNTAGVYAPGVATMECPGTADYGGIADQVPEYSCRLAVIKGAEDAACPPGSLSQTVGLWMTPLASIEWNVTQTIETVTDLRYYTHEYSVDELIPVVNGYNATDGTWLTPTAFFPFDLLDAKICLVNGVWRVPADFARGLIIGPVMVSAGVGNVYASDSMRSGKLAESAETNNYDIAIAAYALDALVNEPFIHTITDAEIGDYFRMQFYRDAVDVLDTIGASVYPYGWRVRYTGALAWK